MPWVDESRTKVRHRQMESWKKARTDQSVRAFDMAVFDQLSGRESSLVQTVASGVSINDDTRRRIRYWVTR